MVLAAETNGTRESTMAAIHSRTLSTPGSGRMRTTATMPGANMPAGMSLAISAR